MSGNATGGKSGAVGNGGNAGPMRSHPGNDKRALPRRFYQLATVSDGAGPFRVLLDGRSVRTPAKTEVAVTSRALADLLTAEWNAQAEVVDPAAMPLTRIVNTALDGVARRKVEVAADIVAFAGNDLLCYRAETPRELARRQEAAWQPVLAWADAGLGARFVTVVGLMPVEQDQAALDAIAAVVEPLDPLALAATHVATTLTGSALLSLAVLRGRLGAEDAWAAAHIDEDFQIEAWGADTDATARRQRRWQEMQAAATIMALSVG